MSKCYKHFGNTIWYEDGVLHRLDGPAIIWANGDTYWYVYNKLHRIDGPAVDMVNGHKAYYIEGQHIEAEEFEEHPERLKYLFEQELERVLSE